MISFTLRVLVLGFLFLTTLDRKQNVDKTTPKRYANRTAIDITQKVLKVPYFHLKEFFWVLHTIACKRHVLAPCYALGHHTRARHTAGLRRAMQVLAAMRQATWTLHHHAATCMRRCCRDIARLKSCPRLGHAATTSWPHGAAMPGACMLHPCLPSHCLHAQRHACTAVTCANLTSPWPAAASHDHCAPLLLPSHAVPLQTAYTVHCRSSSPLLQFA